MKKKVEQVSPEMSATEALVKQGEKSLGPVMPWAEVDEIVDDEHFVQADAALRQIKSMAAQLETQRKEITKPLNDVIKKVNLKCKPLSATLEEAERHIKTLMLSYESAKRALALKKAEKEAKLAEKKGASDLANDIRESALVKVVTPETGISYKDNWKARISNPVDFLTWALQEPSRLNLVQFDTSPLTAVAKNKKTTESGIPGVEFFNDRYVCAGRSE